MISYIKGLLTRATPEFVIVESGGIGYHIFIPANLYSTLPTIGLAITFHTSLIVRESSQTLYGFLSEHERDLFNEVIGISGIGPKTALNLIGHLPPEKMWEAIAADDMQAMNRVPGIGKKTAQRLMIEMRDRSSLFSNFAVDADFNIKKMADAVNALLHLGYKQASAQKAVKTSLASLPESCDLSTLITHALKNV